MLVGSLLPEPKQDKASSVTSLDSESLVSVVLCTQVALEAKVIDFFEPPTQRSVSFCGLSLRMLHTSHCSFLMLNALLHWPSVRPDIARKPTRIRKPLVSSWNITAPRFKGCEHDACK